MSGRVVRAVGVGNEMKKKEESHYKEPPFLFVVAKLYFCNEMY